VRHNLGFAIRQLARPGNRDVKNSAHLFSIRFADDHWCFRAHSKGGPLGRANGDVAQAQEHITALNTRRVCRTSRVHILKNPPQPIFDFAPLQRRPNCEPSRDSPGTPVEETHVADSKLTDQRVDAFLELIRVVLSQQLLTALLDDLMPRLQVFFRIEELLVNHADNAPQDVFPILPAKHHLVACHYLNSTGGKESPTSVNPAQ
jgi:hypothetical protein